MDKNEIVKECMKGQGSAYGNAPVQKRSITSLAKQIGSGVCVILAVVGIGHATVEASHASAPKMTAESIDYQHKLGMETRQASNQECYLVGPMYLEGVTRPDSGEWTKYEQIQAQTVDETTGKPHCNPSEINETNVHVFNNWDDAYKEYQAHSDVSYTVPARPS